MISVENFYWVLFENLLKPVGLDCWYYYPWGTKDSCIKFEFKKQTSKHESHVFFHFDQEPLWSHQLGIYDLDASFWCNKSARILANSEHSEIKKQICKSRQSLDWYFFYHGFAALDWYRDARYVDQEHPIKNAFLSLNHNFHQRSYRLALLARLLDKKIAHKGSISFHVNVADVIKESQNANSKLSKTTKALIQYHTEEFSGLPWILDQVDINGILSARFGHQEYKMWQSSLWHLVNETVFYESKLHLTEKVFKPIVSNRPFILVAAPGNLEYLRGYGFKTFGDWIDESYDSIQDPDQRLDAIVRELSRFAEMSTKQLTSMYQSMLPILQHNKQHFFGNFRDIIVDELVENFDQCIRMWNNGRVDDRQLMLIPDLESVKHTLLR